MEIVNKLKKGQVTILGKTIPVVAVALLLIAGLASAGLLAIYGRVTATVTTAQAVKLDGYTCNADYSTCTVSDTIGEAAPGGEKFCFEHVLNNGASVAANVNFGTTCTAQTTGDCGGVSWSFYNSFGTVGPFSTSGDVLATITKEDLSQSIKWTIHINTSTTEHYGVGLVLANLKDPQHPFQVWMNNGNAKWQSQTLDLNLGATCWNTPVVDCPSGVCPNGINATPSAYSALNPDFTITVPKSLLGGIGSTFNWAMHVETTNQGYYPSTWPNDWCGSITEYAQESTVGSQISNPFTVPSGQAKDFYICYDFAINLVPDTYTIKTDITPA